MQIALAWLGVLLPGLCWWVWFDHEDRDPIEIIARIVGVSVGFIALAALFFFVVGLPIGPNKLIAYLAGLSLIFLTGLVIRKRPKFQPKWLTAILYIGIILVWRFWQARGLVLPNWVDSLHHSLIVRKMVEAGGLTATLEPYLSGPFYYHYAFHSFTAFFSYLSGIDPARSVLLVGQVLIAVISLSAYSLTKAISKDWRAAAATAIFVTFVTKMPGYYLSWGRYTMVVGVLLLGLAIAEAIYLWTNKPTWRKAIAFLVLTSGTLLSHYLAAFLLGLFLLLQGIHWIIESLRHKKWDWQRILYLVIPVIISVLLVLPWYLRIFTYADSALNLSSLRTLDNVTDSQWSYTGYLLGPQVAYPMLAIACAGIFWALTQEKSRVFGLWSLIVAGLTLPLTLQITPFRSDYYALILFLPAAVLAGMLLFWLSNQMTLRLKVHGLAEAVTMSLIFVSLSAGVAENFSAVNSQTILVGQSDIPALDWINEHLPTDARFFINTTSWGYGISRGVDGGAWILPYTGRWSIAPTAFYSFSMETEAKKQLMKLGERAAKISSCDTEFWDLVREAKLDYAYLSDKAGILHPQVLETCQGAVRLYLADGVSVWHLDQNANAGK